MLYLFAALFLKGMSERKLDKFGELGTRIPELKICLCLSVAKLTCYKSGLEFKPLPTPVSTARRPLKHLEKSDIQIQ